MRNILDTKELLGYRLLTGEELSTAAATSVKMGGKGMFQGTKHPAAET